MSFVNYTITRSNHNAVILFLTYIKCLFAPMREGNDRLKNTSQVWVGRTSEFMRVTYSSLGDSFITERPTPMWATASKSK